MYKIRTAIFPVAGLGTRMLPSTKIIPKEMLNLIDKPIIQYAVQEAQDAGVENFIFVISQGKTAIEDHFDQAPLLKEALSKKNKHEGLKTLQETILPSGRMQIVRQSEPLGLGHAIACAQHLIHDPFFAVLLPDDVISAHPSCLSQMINQFNRQIGQYIGIMQVPETDVDKYGIVQLTENHDENIAAQSPYIIEKIIEKPIIENAPSCFAGIGRYILSREIFPLLNQQNIGTGGEIQLTDAIDKLISKIFCFGTKFQGERFDCGHKLGLFEAQLAFALKDPHIKKDALALIKKYAQ